MKQLIKLEESKAVCSLRKGASSRVSGPQYGNRENGVGGFQRSGD